jgi:hypothetical protein
VQAHDAKLVGCENIFPLGFSFFYFFNHNFAMVNII